MSAILYGIRKYAIEGDNAKKVYEAVLGSYTYKTSSESLKMEFCDGVLFIEEKWEYYPHFGDFVLPFLIGDDYYWLSFWGETGEWSTNDDQGRYFLIDQHVGECRD